MRYFFGRATVGGLELVGSSYLIYVGFKLFRFLPEASKIVWIIAAASYCLIAAASFYHGLKECQNGENSINLQTAKTQQTLGLGEMAAGLMAFLALFTTPNLGKLADQKEPWGILPDRKDPWDIPIWEGPEKVINASLVITISLLSILFGALNIIAGIKRENDLIRKANILRGFDLPGNNINSPRQQEAAEPNRLSRCFGWMKNCWRGQDPDHQRAFSPPPQQSDHSPSVRRL